jgi:Mg/Co/Ni transporter MgtE
VLPPSSGQYIPEDYELHTRRRENLKSRLAWLFMERIQLILTQNAMLLYEKSPFCDECWLIGCRPVS